jgi:chorismate mutase
MSSTFRKLTVIEGFDEEEVIEENQDLIPEEAKPVEIVPEKIPQDKGPISNILESISEQDSTTLGTTFSIANKAAQIATGEKTAKELETSLIESIGAAGVSAGIKIPKGLVTFGTLLYDALQEEGIPVEESATGQFNEWFDRTTLGKIEQATESMADETAAGKITEAIGQLYGAGKIASKTAVPVVQNLSKYSRKLVNSIKGGRYVKTTNSANAAKAVEKAAKLNQASKTDKFVAIAVGGGVGGGFIVSDIEDIGTFGDWDFLDFLPTGMDREQRLKGSEDAQRQLLNRFKFGTEMGFPIIPTIVGTGKIGKLLTQKGKDIVYSDSMLERWVDKYIGKPFRSRSNKTQELFDGIQRLEGKKSAAKLLAKDASRNIDDSLREISRETRGAAQAIKDPEAMSKIVSDFMFTTDDIVKKKNILFPGFNQKSTTAFKAALEKLGVPKNSINKIISDATTFRETSASLKNLIGASKNVFAGVNKLNSVLNERLKNVLAVDYRLVDENAGLFNQYKPIAEDIERVAKVLQRYAKNNGKSLDDETANKLVNDITKNAFKDKTTNALVFDIGEMSALADKPVQRVNIGNYITSGKFKPDGKGGLIQTKSDLQAFTKLFGEYKNAQNGIYNVMTDLSETVARDNFYTDLIKSSDDIAKQLKAGADPGQIGRPIFFKTYNEAVTNLPYQEIIKQPLKLKTRLPDTVYASPLDGYFTTVPYAEAIRVGDALVGSGITRNFWWRTLNLIPKGLSQASKTILGPFTHMRNFFSSMFTTIHRGNILIPPQKIVEFANRSRKAVQPQMMYRLTGNKAYRNMPEDQALYRFLLEEGVTNQNIVARDLEGIFKDIGQIRTANMRADQFFKKILNTGTQKFKRLYDVAQDLYTAEDDIFRVYNFLAETYKLSNAFDVAIKKGLKDATGKAIVKPNDLELMKEAAQIVRETVPNYAYVSDFVKGVRRSPFGSFAAFPAEIYRTGVNTTARALKEIKDPVRKEIGYKSLVGQGFTYAALPPLAVETFRALYGITRETLEAIREVLPTWSEDDTILPVYENGKYKYIDFSHGFFYDTMTAPVQTVLTKVQMNPDQPLMPMMLEGMAKAVGKVMQPFVQESIWTGVVLDLFARGGKTKEGRQIWNERAPDGDKFKIAMEYATKELSPGSREQVIRLFKALTDQTVKGTKYEIPDELMGLFGFRKVPLDLKKTLNFRIQEFNRDTRAERSLIYQGTRTGDPVKDQNQIIRQYVLANKQRLETYSKMRRLYDAVKVLGMRDPKIAEIFIRRNSKPLYQFIENNRFEPFSVSKNVIRDYAIMAKEKNIPNPLNRRVLKQLKKIEKQLYKQRLNKDFIINEEDYLLPEPNTSMVPPLPEMPQPNVSVAQQTPNVMQTGLTPVETALLSEEEKMIALKNRGLV